MSIRGEIHLQLLEHAEAEYKEFNDKIAIPGYPSLGVRMPTLRKISKQLAKSSHFHEYCSELENEIHQQLGVHATQAEVDAFVQKMQTASLSRVAIPYYEEIVVWANAIGYANISFEERLVMLDAFVPCIRDWASCDTCMSSYKFISKHKAEMWDYLQKWIKSPHEFETRFALVCFLDYYIEDEYLLRLFDLCQSTDRSQYYVQMAIAWLVSMIYVPYPDETIKFLKSNKMSKWTHNKAIQKIRESLRVPKEEKEYLKTLKRP